MSICIFCSSDTKAILNSKHQHHLICKVCKSRDPSNISNNYCCSCYNERLLTKRKCNECTYHKFEITKVVYSCNYHVYCSFQLNDIKKESCKICKFTFSKFCYKCFKFYEESDINFLHHFHSLCTDCLSKEQEIECPNCQTNLNAYKNKYKVKRKNICAQGNKTKISKDKKYEILIKPPELKNQKEPEYNIKNIHLARQEIKVINNSNQYDYPSQYPYSNSFQDVPTNYDPPYNTCQKHNIPCYFTLCCKLHIFCKSCIFDYILLKFNKFIIAFQMKDLKWLNKLHRYGCYHQNCYFANFSYQIHSISPDLLDYISKDYPEFLSLLNYFIPFLEGFDFKFHLCFYCKTNIVPQSNNYCLNCYSA